MRHNALLLERKPAIPPSKRAHTGKVAVGESNQRWCSNGFEFSCDNGEKLSVTFALDCCDREALHWTASNGGYDSETVQDVMLGAVERRFGSSLPSPPIEWLTDTRSEKLRQQVEEAEALLKQQEQQSDRYNGREEDPLVPRQLRQSRHRRPLPEHLPREIHRLEPAETCCPECGNGMKFLSEVSAEQLELVSSALKVIRTVRVKKAGVRCDCIVEAPAASRSIDRGIAGPGLLARVLTSKYCEHTPLYRQTEILARQGVDLSRVLLSN